MPAMTMPSSGSRRRLQVVPAILGLVASALMSGLPMAATPRLFDSLSTRALWFFSAGITLVLAGALNLLNRRYGLMAPGLRRVCIATNVFLTGFTIVSGVVSGASVVELIIIVAVMVASVVLASFPRALQSVG